jgi:hypothetical protein
VVFEKKTQTNPCPPPHARVRRLRISKHPEEVSHLWVCPYIHPLSHLALLLLRLRVESSEQVHARRDAHGVRRLFFERLIACWFFFCDQVCVTRLEGCGAAAAARPVNVRKRTYPRLSRPCARCDANPRVVAGGYCSNDSRKLGWLVWFGVERKPAARRAARRTAGCDNRGYGVKACLHYCFCFLSSHRPSCVCENNTHVYLNNLPRSLASLA